MVCQELLTRNKSASAEFLEANYDKFFSHYQNLLSSDNYVTRRQALKVSCLFGHCSCIIVTVAEQFCSNELYNILYTVFHVAGWRMTGSI